MHRIDMSGEPALPFADTRILSHHPQEPIKWVPERLGLHFERAQFGEDGIEGHELRRALEESLLPIANACLLDALLAHQELVPLRLRTNEEDVPLCIYAWGTLYERPPGLLLVRGMRFSGTGWKSFWHWLDARFRGTDAAAYLSQLA